jgi:hypothetical protein
LAPATWLPDSSAGGLSKVPRRHDPGESIGRRRRPRRQIHVYTRSSGRRQSLPGPTAPNERGRRIQCGQEVAVDEIAGVDGLPCACAQRILEWCEGHTDPLNSTTAPQSAAGRCSQRRPGHRITSRPPSTTKRTKPK